MTRPDADGNEISCIKETTTDANGNITTKIRRARHDAYGNTVQPKLDANGNEFPLVSRLPRPPRLDADGNEIPFVRRENNRPRLDADGNVIPFVRREIEDGLRRGGVGEYRVPRGGTRGDIYNRGPR